METKSHGSHPKEKETKATVQDRVLRHVRENLVKAGNPESVLFNAYDGLPRYLSADNAFVIEIGRIIDEFMYHHHKQGGEHVC